MPCLGVGGAEAPAVKRATVTCSGNRAAPAMHPTLWKKLFSGGFETAITRVTVKITFSTVGCGTAGDKPLSSAGIVKNLYYKLSIPKVCNTTSITNGLYLRFATRTPITNGIYT